VFDEDSGLWTTCDTIKNKLISKYAPIGFNSNLNAIKTLREFVCIFCIDNNWLKQKNSSGLGKLLFNNGYYDGDTKKFHSVFNPEVVFFSKIHHDYVPFTDEDQSPLNDLILKYFTNPLNLETGAYYIDTLAKGLFGFRHKRFLMGLGAGNNGKSKLLEALSLACGDYIGVFNGENLAYSKSSADEAAQNRWMMLLQHKRIVYSSEIKMDIIMNGNAIKKMTGGDMMSGRTHNKEETLFEFHPLPILCANDIPKITPYDKAVDERIRVCSYKKTYVVGATGPDELEKDLNLDAEIKSTEFQRLLVLLFIQKYTKVLMDEPDDVINAKKEWIDETADLIQNIQLDFTFTNLETDYVTAKELNEWAVEKKLGVSSTKLGREITKYAEKKGLNLITTKIKKVCGKSTSCWVGIKSESIDMI
jgi:phage/plasmid-associated DNA primase